MKKDLSTDASAEKMSPVNEPAVPSKSFDELMMEIEQLGMLQISAEEVQSLTMHMFQVEAAMQSKVTVNIDGIVCFRNVQKHIRDNLSLEKINFELMFKQLDHENPMVRFCGAYTLRNLFKG